MSLPSRRLQWLALGVLGLGGLGLDLSSLLAWFTLALVGAAGLKLGEARTREGRRLVALVQLICCGLLAAQRPELLASLLQLLATLLALAGLLSLETGAALPWPLLVRRSLRVVAAALPLALVLFLLVPRLAPLGNGGGGQGARGTTGLNAQLDPGSIAELASDAAPAARVAFSGDRPPATGERYWRVLVHPRFDGRRWEREESEFQTLPAGPVGQRVEQLWLVEPSPFTAVPWDGRSLPMGPRLRRDPLGELVLDVAPAELRAYPLAAGGASAGWQQQVPRLQELLLPRDGDPRLQALGQSWQSAGPPEQRLAAAQAWFLAGGFRYDTNPGALPERDGLDAFLFDSRVGFCGHYASAFTALMRAAGVPARVVSGYYGGTWVVPLGGSPFLELRQSDAHAWSEVWLPGRGWQRVDPSSWASGSPGDGGGSVATGRNLNSWQWLQRQWWGLDVAWSRWWLGFDQAGQEALLQRLFGDHRQAVGWVLLAGLAVALLVGLRLVGRPASGRRPDWLAQDLSRLLALLQRLGVSPAPGESLEALCERAGAGYPVLAPLLHDLARQHTTLRYAGLPPDGPAGQRARQAWKLALGRLCRSHKDAIRTALRPMP